MTAREDQLLSRWCRRGDAAALGELFDLAAPRLLKIAIHLVGEPAEAEDLVQATFLAAVEGRERIDPGRPALPWLSGVLAHKATDVHRLRGRTLDPARLSERLSERRSDRAVEGASEPAERKEHAGEIAKAIDRLDEPYRQVLLLRMRHGMAFADIAHVSGESAGTVRVRHHRALEQLKRLLPPSLAALLAAGCAPPRGLAAVKSVVLGEALRFAVPLGLASSIGAFLVSQKAIAVGAGALAVAALVALRFGGERPALPVDAPAVIRDAGALEHESHEVDAVGAPAAAPDRAEVAQAVGEERSGHRIAGRVFDFETGEPIAGARVELHAPSEELLSDVVTRHPELFRIGRDGIPRARTRGDWPYLEQLSAVARFGGETARVFGVVEEGAEASATGVSDEEGRFSLPCDAFGGVLLCEADGYGRRARAAHDATREWPVGLERERVLTGRVLGPGRAPPDRPFQLAFSAMRAPDTSPGVLPGDSGTPRLLEAEEIEGLGVWETTTDSDGGFTVRVAADEVMAAVLDPGWRIVLGSHLPAVAPAEIIVQRVHLLRFADAASGAPIERVRLQGREQRNGYIRWSGEFDAPGGMLTLPGDLGLLRWHAKDTLSFFAWAEGYAPASFSVVKPHRKGETLVELEPGPTCSLEGIVHRRGSPVDRIEVALLGQSPLQWRPDEDTLVDAVRTDAHGRFLLTGPIGKALVRVAGGEGHYFELVELPAVGPLDIDLDNTGQIDVLVADTRGVARANHVVGLSGDDGRSFRAYADDEGRVTFADLCPGEFKVIAPFVTTESSFGADLLVVVQLERGEKREVFLELPFSEEPRFARVVYPGVADYSTWRARFDQNPWQALRANGTVPMDLSTESFTLGVQAPDGRRWSVSIPKAAPDGHVIQLAGGSGSYRGTITGPDGEGVKGWRIHATPWGPHEGERVTATCLSGDGGAFELAGLAPCTYRLEFSETPDAMRWSRSGSEYEYVSFVPNEPPGDGTWLDVRLTRASETVRVHGQVRSESSGEPLADALIHVECALPGATGRLQIGGDLSFHRTDGDGRFDMLLPRTPERRIRVYSGVSGTPALLTLTTRDSGQEEEPPLDLVVP